jgi:hypothetical protein
MLKFKDLITVDYAPGEPDEIKYRRHRKRRAMDETPDEALSMAQRLKKARDFKRNRAKIALGKKRAARRVASKEVLQKRARRAARNKILLKITKDIPRGELTIARKAEIEKRLDKPEMKTRIDRLAKKMFPLIRKAEMQRKRGGSSK